MTYIQRASVLGLATAAVVLVAASPARADKTERNFAGSIQLDYMAVPSDSVGRKLALDGFSRICSTYIFHRRSPIPRDTTTRSIG